MSKKVGLLNSKSTLVSDTSLSRQCVTIDIQIRTTSKYFVHAQSQVIIRLHDYVCESVKRGLYKWYRIHNGLVEK